jgi:outer membrane protein assembly factor BamB
MKISALIRHTLVAGALTAILAACAQGPVSKGFDWPRWRGPDGNGISKETGWNPQALAGGPRILWKANVGSGYSNVAIRGNRLYTMGFLKKKKGTVVFCLWADTGKRIWQSLFPCKFDFPQSTPTTDGTSVYALSNEGILLCLNAQNGKLRWKKDLVSEYGAVKPYYRFAGSPVVEGESLILTVNSAGLALNRETGQLIWNSAAPPPPEKIKVFWAGQTSGTDYTVPVIYDHNGKRYALLSSWKGISAVDVESGKPSWLYEWELYSGNNITDPVISGDTIFITNEFSKLRTLQSVLVQIQGDKPEVLWKSPELWANITTPVILDGYIYGCRGGPDAAYADLRCLDLQTGRLMWKQHLGTAHAQESLSLMAADGKLIILNDQGMLYIAEATPTGYKEISSCDVLRGEKPHFLKVRKFWTPPVLCNGRIYCRNYAGDLICIDVSK